MSEQSISIFYVPNITTNFKIIKKDLNKQLSDIDEEIVQDNEDCSILTYGIADFWKTNNSYKKLIEPSGIVELSNKELQKSTKTNLEALYNHNSNYNMIIDNIKDEVDSLSSNEAESNNIEAQVIFLWKFKHYWSKSIAAKMNISKITVNKILKKFRQLVKSRQINNLKARAKANRVIKDSQIEEIKKYIESIDSKPLKLSMIKHAVWPYDSEAKPPSNSTISKVLKNKLKMSYKILHKWNTKRRDLQNQRLFIESLFLQTLLKESNIETIYIDEFKFSSRK